MKKCQILLMGMLSLAALSCQQEELNNNPNYNPETREVDTQFVLSVSTSGEAQQPNTKMTADVVQKNSNFRGMTDAVIFTFKTGAAAGSAFVNSSTTAADKRFDMGNLYTNGAINNPANNATSESNRVLHLSIPVGTDAVLIYGKAAIASNQGQGKAIGYTTAIIKDKPEETVFKAVRRMPEEKVASYDATARLMIFVINRIMQSLVEEATATEAEDYGYTIAELPAISWRDLGLQYEINNNMRTGTAVTQTGLEEILGKAYSTFTNIRSGEFRSGSSASVKWMMQEMDSVVGGVIAATPTSAKEANAKRLASQISIRMNRYFNTTTWAYKSYDDIQKVVLGENLTGNILTPAQWNDSSTGFVGAANLNGYPYEDFTIPEGAAQLAIDANGVFSYLHPNKALVTPGVTFEPRKYIFAPELFYYDNSPVRVTDKANLMEADFPDGVGPWDDATSTGNKWTAGNWSVGSVKSSTRGVAVKNNINYGVAMLKTSVAWTTEATGAGHLLDNRKAMTNNAETDREIDLADTKLELRGVLIGGVNPRMNWQFLRRDNIPGKAEDSSTDYYPNFDGVIYDDAIANTGIPTPADGENYTLVYDNYNSGLADDATQSSVFVALEFVNNGDDFWGRDNLIRKGGVFYLCAELKNDTTNQGSITWPTYYQIPPLYGVDGAEVPSGKVAGQSKQIPRVFIQNFMTTAIFRIGLKSLQKAYSSVPDLRSTQMSLGMSVDLSWQSGYTYDIEF